MSESYSYSWYTEPEPEKDYSYYYSYSDSDEEEPLIDSVVGIEILDSEICIRFCEGHQVSWNTLDHMIDKCSKTKLKIKYKYCSKSRRKKQKYFAKECCTKHFICPAIDSSGEMCGKHFNLEHITSQISDPSLVREFTEKFAKATDRYLRKKAFEKVRKLAECPNPKCPGEHIGLRSLGVRPRRSHLKFYGNSIFMTSLRKLRHCHDCNWIWCTECDGTYFTVDGLDHRGTTCSEMRVLRNPSESEKLTEKLIKMVAVRCPGCGTGIAIKRGCNRIQCTNCKKFFCYICHNKAYSNSDDVYTHLKEMHGNTYNSVSSLVPAKGSIDRIKDVRQVRA